MNYLANYYMNMCEQLEQRIAHLQKILAEANQPAEKEELTTYPNGTIEGMNINPKNLSPEEKSKWMATHGDSSQFDKKDAEIISVHSQLPRGKFTEMTGEDFDASNKGHQFFMQQYKYWSQHKDINARKEGLKDLVDTYKVMKNTGGYGGMHRE